MPQLYHELNGHSVVVAGRDLETLLYTAAGIGGWRPAGALPPERWNGRPWQGWYIAAGPGTVWAAEDCQHLLAALLRAKPLIDAWFDPSDDPPSRTVSRADRRLARDPLSDRDRGPIEILAAFRRPMLGSYSDALAGWFLLVALLRDAGSLRIEGPRPDRPTYWRPPAVVPPPVKLEMLTGLVRGRRQAWAAGEIVDTTADLGAPLVAGRRADWIDAPVLTEAEPAAAPAGARRARG